MGLNTYNSYKSINLSSNPISDEKGDDFKKELLIKMGSMMGGLKRINKNDITQEDKDEATAEQEVRRLAAIEEQNRLDAEEAEKAALLVAEELAANPVANDEGAAAANEEGDE